LMERDDSILVTIDMKSKTTASKHRTDQGFGFGLRGMSTQGAMVERYVRPWDGGPRYREVSYFDIVCCQSSNQSVEEAMSAVDVMMGFINENYPDVNEVAIVSDKCSNFNSLEQIPFMMEGNHRGWTHDPSHNRGLRVTEWTFSEAQRGKDQLDCNLPPSPPYLSHVPTSLCPSLTPSLPSFLLPP
jgi:hypothetical protein